MLNILIMSEEAELKLELERQLRTRSTLEKFYERRKRLKLCDPAYESQITSELRELASSISALQRKIRSIESEQIRKKLIGNN
jgi:hypothetical protein